MVVSSKVLGVDKLVDRFKELHAERLVSKRQIKGTIERMMVKDNHNPEKIMLWRRRTEEEEAAFVKEAIDIAEKRKHEASEADSAAAENVKKAKLEPKAKASAEAKRKSQDAPESADPHQLKAPRKPKSAMSMFFSDKKADVKYELKEQGREAINIEDELKRRWEALPVNVRDAYDGVAGRADAKFSREMKVNRDF